MDSQTHQKYTILLIEDQKGDQEDKQWVQKQKLPYAFVVVGSVQELKDTLQQKRDYDLVLTDDRLKDGNIHDILDLLFNLNPEKEVQTLPIIVMTSYDHKTIISDIVKKGVYAYFLKDGDFQSFLPVTIKNAIEHSKVLKRWKNTEILLQSLYHQLSDYIDKGNGEIKEMHENLEQNYQIPISHTHRSEGAKQSKIHMNNLSHKFRTPLNVILPNIQMLRDQFFGALNGAQMERIDHIFRQGKKLLSIIEQLDCRVDDRHDQRGL